MTVSQDSINTAKFTATATAKYPDGKEQTQTPTLTLESNYGWITFDASTGVVTAKPTANVNADDYSVKITATATADGITQTATASLTVTVNAKSTLVTLNDIVIEFTQAPKNMTVYGGGGDNVQKAAFSATAKAMYSDGSTKTITPVYDISDHSLSWLEIDGNTGILSAYTKKADTPGSYTVQVTATCTEGSMTRSVSTSMVIEVRPDPRNNLVITFDSECPTVLLKQGESIDVSYKAHAIYADVYNLISDIPVTLTYEPVNGNPDVNGTKSGTNSLQLIVKAPGKAESYTYAVRAHAEYTYDNVNLTADAVTYTTVTGYGVDHISVEADDVYLESLENVSEQGNGVISEDLTKYADVKNFYTDGSSLITEAGTLTFEAVGEWPSWIKISGTNVIITPPLSSSGERVTDGTYTYKVTATDPEAKPTTVTDTGTINVTVIEASAPVIETTTAVLPKAFGMYYQNEKLKYGESYKQTLTASGMKPLTWSIVSGSLPTGLELKYDANAGTATIAGEPADEDIGRDFNFTLEAKNGAGTDSWDYTIRVSEVGPSTWKVTNTGNAKSNTNKALTYMFYETKAPHVNYKFLGMTYDWNGSETELQGAVVIKDWTNNGKRLPGAGSVKVSIPQKSEWAGKNTTVNIYLSAENDGGTSQKTETVTISNQSRTTSVMPAGLNIANAVNVADSDGNISVIIGGDESGEYVFNSFEKMLEILGVKGQLDKVVSVEFRKGASVPDSFSPEEFEKLPNLGELKISECPTLKSLNLSGTPVYMVDIDDCAALTSLNLGGCTSLESLLVFDCPKLDDNGFNVYDCKNLEVIFLREVAVSGLNLNTCTNLQTLDVTACNSVANIDVSNCAGLKSISAAYTEITSLNLSGNTELEDVFLNCTNLTALDLSKATNLKSLSLTNVMSLDTLSLAPTAKLDEFNLSGTKITGLDFSGNTEITELNLSNNNALSSLKLANCTGLKNLNIKGTLISELDLTGCTALEVLNADDCGQLSGIKNLNECTNLKELSFDGAKIKSLDLSGNSSLTELNLSSNRSLTSLKLANCTELQELNVTGSMIESLDLTGCWSLVKLSANGCDKLETLTLGKLDNVKEIYLRSTGIKALDCGGCGNLISLDLKASTKLISLNARGCSLKSLNVDGCKNLKELDCSGNSLGWLNLDGLVNLNASTVNYSGQVINGWTPDSGAPAATRIRLNDYIGDNDVKRIIEINGYDADGTLLEPVIEEADAVFETAPVKVEYLYDTGFGYGEPMDVTLSGATDPKNLNPNGSGGGCDLVRSEELGVRSVLVLALFLLCLMEFALIKKSGIKKP